MSDETDGDGEGEASGSIGASPLGLSHKEIKDYMDANKLVHPLLLLLRWANGVDEPTKEQMAMVSKVIDYVQPKLVQNSNTGVQVGENTAYEMKVSQAELVKTLWAIFPDGKLPVQEG